MSLRARLGALVLALTACGSPTGVRPLPTCADDSDCSAGQLCYAEGCGDPGRNVVVEVAGGSLTGQQARDFAIADGTLTRSTDFDLGPPLTVMGEFQRERTVQPDPTNRAVYAETVVVRATGESVLIPGLRRSYEARFESPERGRFQMNLGSGRYALTALPADRSVPPLRVEPVEAREVSTADSVTFTFPAADGAALIAGQLVTALSSKLIPGQPVPLTASNVEVQVFDAETREPLSQRFPVSSTTGEFQIAASPEVRSRSALLLVAGPREPGTPVPTKTFRLTAPLPPAVVLEYGEFGEPRPVSGRVVDASGHPVVGAQVLLEGQVTGDGTFRSLVAETDAGGKFRLECLASRQAGSFTATVAPPKNSRSSYSRITVTVTVRDGEATLNPDVLTLEDRLLVRGQVVRPDGAPASGVGLRATVQAQDGAGDSRTLPREPAEAMTDSEGAFELSLDPGLWRFEYYPSESLPLASRLVTVRAPLDDDGKPLPTLTLPTVRLANGRRVQGTVTGTMGSREAAPVPYAQLRFFRSTSVEGRPSAILLGTATADERGRYEVILPDTRR
jgi:hypothetical protein